MPVTRELRGSTPRHHVELDLTPQVLALSIPVERTWDERGEELSPVCDNRAGFVSASMLAIKAKLFDDGLYAAVELAAQRGAGGFAGKAGLLAQLVRHAPAVAAAASLGGQDVALDDAAREIRDTFLANELKSKPLGFYTWSDELRRIFQQDRLLQEPLEDDRAAVLAAALRADPVASRTYASYLELVAKLTNPLASDKPDLRKPDGAYFFPPSRAHESDLMKKLFGMKPIPEGFELAAEMILRIRDGSLKLEPTADSGWYDWQTWALEPLLLLEKMPEGKRLKSDVRYREQLDELFKAILALTRETHVKQLEMLEMGAAFPGGEPQPIVWVAPELSLEPVVSYYERRAQGYDFVQRVLESTFGDALALDELVEIASVFRGAAAVAAEELGMRAASERDAIAFRAWSAKHDPKLHNDVRMMVPVFFDIGRGKTKVWMVLGWSTRDLHVDFATPPLARVKEGRVEVRFQAARRSIAYPVFAEAYVTRLLDRDEFRAHCSRWKSRKEILAHLP